MAEFLLPVMPGLDPGIHQSLQEFCESDGSPGQARQDGNTLLGTAK
jgi:hypothetical protein